MAATAYVVISAIAFLLGLAIGLAGLLLLLRERKREWKKRRVWLTAAMFTIGSAMVIIPVGQLLLLREDNSYMYLCQNEAYQELDQKAEYHSEEIDGKRRRAFEYNGVKYAEVLPAASEEWRSVSRSYPESKLKKENAVLNIESENMFLKKLVNLNDQETLYMVPSDSSADLLVGASVYCPEDQLGIAESYYEDFCHYKRFGFAWDGAADSGTKDEKAKVVLDPDKLNLLQSLDQADQRPVSGSQYYTITCTSSDGVFVADVQLLHKGRSWHLRTGEVETGDDIEDMYTKLPKDLSSYFDETLYQTIGISGITFRLPADWRVSDLDKSTKQICHGDCDENGTSGEEYTALNVSFESASSDEDLSPEEALDAYENQIKQQAQKSGEELKRKPKAGEIGGMPARVIHSKNPKDGSEIRRALLLNNSEIISFGLISTIPEDIEIFEQALHDIERADRW